MAKLYFKYGTMNSGKSLEIIKVAHNYEEQDKPVMIFTSALDDRQEVGKVWSRANFERPAIPIYSSTNIFEEVAKVKKRIYCVLIDEVQFLDRDHIIQLTQICDQLKIPVMAFGLKNDFQNNLFEGSQNMLVYADKIEEIKTICWFCDKKATMNLRLNNGQPVYEGEQIQIGGNDQYLPVCRKHYNEPCIKSL
ncbi:thymidine kinase [Hutsoniella sourekii]